MSAGRDLTGAPTHQGISSVLGWSVQSPTRMRGAGFEWDHEIQVALPPSYETSGEPYPVLWVTDGYIRFSSTVESVAILVASKAIPEMIVVGIGNPADGHAEFEKRRAFDLSSGQPDFSGFGAELFASEHVLRARYDYGGAPRFLDFLVCDVRRWLKSVYRSSDMHTLFGHSAGGFFCAYAFITQSTDFDCYICSSPNLYANDHQLFRLEEQHARQCADLKASIFFGAGEGEILEGGSISAWGIVSSMARMAEILRLRNYPSLRLLARIFPHERHTPAGLMSLRYGLQALWEGHPPLRQS